AADLDTMQKLGIVRVVNCTRGCPNFHPDQLAYLRLELADAGHQKISHCFDAVVSAIDCARAAGGACLVHCTAGISRSPALVIAYLMKTKRWSLAAALAHMQKCRPSVSPNPAFMAQLAAYEASLFARP
ncbi:protein-tyrosine phosphatase-like protein, partial [Tribonema minus]